MKIDLSCPVELNSLVLNEETQTAELELFNLSQQTITAVKYTLVLFDEDGAEIERVPAELEGISFTPQDTYEAVVSAENAKSVEVIFTEITFEDETVFAPEGTLTDINFEEAEGTELERIIRAGAHDGCCYAKEEDNYWLCVCGRPDLPSSENCIRGDRLKDDVLKKFISEESVALTVLNKEDNDAIILAEEKAERKENTLRTLKKSGIIAAIVVAALLICFFAFKLIVTSIGDSNAKAKNYEKAYSMYKLAGSGKLNNIANRVYGNTSTNLESIDIMAQDDNNIYYSDLVNIYKQDKATGKQSVLKNVSAHSLNATGGYLYYINMTDNGKIYKISPDGKTNEAICDSPASGIFTVLNDVYFISPAAANATDTTNIKAKAPIYVLKAGAVEPELVLDVDVQSFAIYNNKLYYTDPAENLNLKCVKLSGGKPKTLIDTSVYDFMIKDNKIYYIDGGSSDSTPLSLEAATLKGKHKETLIDTAIITTFSISDNTIYYSDYNNQGILFKKEAGKDAVAYAESVAVANISEGAVFYYSNDGTFHISNLDKSGFDLVETPKADEAETTPGETDESTEEPAATEATPAE